MVSDLMIALSPLLAERQFAEFEGSRIVLSGDFSLTAKKRLPEILRALPANIINWFGEDLYSPKMSRLLIDRFNLETHPVRKHFQAIYLASKRPKGWASALEPYLIRADKNSFYLFDLIRVLRHEYRYAFLGEDEKDDIEYVVKKIIAKNHFGKQNPTKSEIKKIAGSIVLPPRDN